MIPDYFSSQCIENNPYHLRHFYNQRFVKSLSSLINTAGRGFGKDYTRLQSLLNSLNLDKKFEPYLHAIHAKLALALKANSAADVLKLIKSLTQILEQGAEASTFLVHTITAEPWEQEILESLKEQNRNQAGKLATIDAINEDHLNKYAPIIHEVLSLLKQASLLFYEEFETYVAEIKLFHRLVGMTDPRVFGSVYICTPNTELPAEVYFCEHIIHETSHLHLNTLFAHDCLILNDPSEKYAAPIRPDPRPMYGIFHATFVLSRMVRLFRKLVVFLTEPAYSRCLKTFQTQFLNGYHTVTNHAKLTPYGQKIVQSYADLVEAQ